MGVMGPTSRHFVIHELSKGIYAAVATDGGWAVCNAGIVDLGDAALVFDTFVNQHAAAELKTAAERLTGKPVGIVVNSHWHSDHVKGNQAFAGAKVVATEKTLEVMKKMKLRYDTEPEVIKRDVEKDLASVLAGPDGEDRILNEGYDRGHLDGLPTLKYTLPTETFGERVELGGGRRQAEAVTYGGGHTVSDSLLHLPEDRVLFLGDLLFINYQPYLADGNPVELLRILDRIEALDAKTLVPGHGPVGTPKDISAVRDYVQLLERTVTAVRSKGGNASEAVRVPIAAPFHTWKWRGFYKENLEFLFKANPGPGVTS